MGAKKAAARKPLAKKAASKNFIDFRRGSIKTDRPEMPAEFGKRRVSGL